MSAKQVEDLAQKIYEFQYELQQIGKIDGSSIELLSGRISEINKLADDCRRIFPIILAYMHSPGAPKFDLADRILSFDCEKKELQTKLDESSKKLEEQVTDIIDLGNEVDQLKGTNSYLDLQMKSNSKKFKELNDKLREENLLLKEQLDKSLSYKESRTGLIRKGKSLGTTKSAVILKATNEWLVVEDDSSDDMWFCIVRNGAVRGIKTTELDTKSSRMIPLAPENFSIEQLHAISGRS